MKTLKEIEEDFETEFWPILGSEKTEEDIRKSDLLHFQVKQFYRQAIAEILGEVVGEDCQCLGLDDKAELWIDGYDSAKAEIRERIKSILE